MAKNSMWRFTYMLGCPVLGGITGVIISNITVLPISIQIFLGVITCACIVPIWYIASRLMVDSYKRLKEKENENDL